MFLIALYCFSIEPVKKPVKPVSLMSIKLGNLNFILITVHPLGVSLH